MKLTRRVAFSSGHRYWDPRLTAELNRLRYGQWAHPHNHGHNYVLEVTTAGSVDPVNGMVVNIKRIDDILKAVILKPFDQRSLNDDVPHFKTVAPSLENLLLYIADQLRPALPTEARLTHLFLEEHPLLWGELDLETDAMTLTRRYEFAASHRLHAPDLSAEENVALYGKCNNLNGHGHNYVLDVTVEGTPNDAGFLCDLGALDEAVEREVVGRYDHRNLNEDLPEFAGRVTTSEVVAQEIFDRLKDHVPARLARVRLWETARNLFEVTQPSA